MYNKSGSRPNAIELKSAAEVEIMRRAGRLLAQVLQKVAEQAREGVSTLALDRLARDLIMQAGARPAFLGYEGFPATLCVSINEEVVHGIPSARRILAAGDLVSIDCGLILEGFFADMAVTVGIPPLTPMAERLMKVTREALMAAIGAVRPNARLGDLGAAVESVVNPHRFGIVQEYTGHGIGRNLHEPPKIPNYGRAGTGIRLQEGMTLAIEPMINEGTARTLVLDDDWTVVTEDGGKSCHFEHTVAVTAQGAEILTVCA